MQSITGLYKKGRRNFDIQFDAYFQRTEHAPDEQLYLCLKNQIKQMSSMDRY